jgi:hypothetical protein
MDGVSGVEEAIMAQKRTKPSFLLLFVTDLSQTRQLESRQIPETNPRMTTTRTEDRIYLKHDISPETQQVCVYI